MSNEIRSMPLGRRSRLSGRMATRWTAGGTVVRVRRPLDDLGALRARSDLRRVVVAARPGDLVVLDLHDCDFVNARGLRLLMHLIALASSRGARMVLVDPPVSLRQLTDVVPGAPLATVSVPA